MQHHAARLDVSKPEQPDEWTQPVATRISKKAEKALADKLAKSVSSSRAAYVRHLIYRDLGLLPTEEGT